MALVEVCVDDVEGVRRAAAAGAGRVELCSALSEGGITPSVGLVRRAMLAAAGLPVHVILRPRGGDFVYDADELAVVVEDAQALPADGLVFGALTPDGGIDEPALAGLRAAAPEAGITFHKAFDATSDLTRSLDVLIGHGVDRVLTSGGRATALDGADVLAGLVERAAGRIVIMAGGGVRAANVGELVRRTGVGEVHLRAAVRQPSASRFVNPELAYDPGSRLVTSAEMVRAVVANSR